MKKEEGGDGEDGEDIEIGQVKGNEDREREGWKERVRERERER